MEKETTFKAKKLSTGTVVLSPHFKDTLFYGKIQKTNTNESVKFSFMSSEEFDRTNVWNDEIPEKLKNDAKIVIEAAKILGGLAVSENSILIQLTDSAYKKFRTKAVREDLEATIIKAIDTIEFNNRIV